MAIKKSGISGIPFGNTASRPASPSLGQPYFNGEVGRLELYSSNGWQNIVQETPGVASASGTYNQSTGSGTFTIAGTNFVDGGLVYAIGTNGTEYAATTSTTNSIVQMTALFTGLSAAYEPYDIKVLNPSNLFGLLPDAFYINDSPVWSTTAGTLGTWAGSNIQLSATDDESNTITYSVTSGSLPTGLSLSSAGLISGTSTANPATYTFTVSASDGSNTAVTRSFSIIAPFPTVSGGTLTSDATYYYRTFTATSNLIVSSGSLTTDILMVGAGGGGGSSLTGGGGGGAVGTFTSVSIPVGTNAVTVGAGGTCSSSSSDFGGSKGTATSLLNISLLGGGGAPNRDTPTTWGQNNDTNGGANGGGSSSDGPSSSTPRLGISQSVPNGITGTIYSGYSGGAGSGGSPNYPGGGGAGANGSGQKPPSSSSAGGTGGNGKQINFITHNFYWGGGGGGSAYMGGAGGGAGGLGGGGGGSTNSGAGGAGGGSALNSGQSGSSGNGDPGANLIGGNGGANTGGGGGSGSHGSGLGGSGGSGIVIIRYTKAQVEV